MHVCQNIDRTSSHPPKDDPYIFNTFGLKILYYMYVSSYVIYIKNTDLILKSKIFMVYNFFFEYRNINNKTI